MDSETPVSTKPKRVLKQHQLENLRKGREARMKKLEDKKNELNIYEQTVPQSVTTLSDIPEQPIIIEREKPVKPKKQETPVPVQVTPVPVQETPVPVQETPVPCFNICKIPDEYPGKTNYCFKRKYIKEYFSTLRDLSQLKLSTHYYNKRKKL